jgi:hypothetical protein
MRQKGNVMVIPHRVSKGLRVVGQTAAAGALVIAGIVSFATVAGANAADPNADTSAAETVNGDGTVTVDMSGTWTWAGQDCAGRYGTGWAVDWWGISTSATPTNNFTLTDATIVTPPGTTTTGSITATGTAFMTAHPLSGGQFFHVSTNYNGETVNSNSTCTDSGGGSSASWSASATYPNQADIPPAICVNMYDEHGMEGTISTDAKDFDPVTNDDNSINTNAFDPTVGEDFCSTPHVVNPAPTTTTTKASATTVATGTAVTDAVTVTGSAAIGQPAGTVAFFVCGPTPANALCTSTATPAGTATLPHSGDTGFVSTGTSSAFTPTTAGTYCFAAVFTPAPASVYSASSDNNTGTVDAAECFVATGASAPASGGATPVTPAATPPAAAPVAGATIAFTGEPWAGSKGIELGVAIFGMGLLTLGMLRRRSLRRGAEARTR